ncbi:multiheme c-type cytochrome [Thermodesulfatator autotrophicus]|uniref:Cytochrome c-552/4 domain-containing protein n=1 Tax=Thermodesulfatator autotrophicus TaxID=1795632 RepID=A0A177E8W7_9BACT|nr:multiheme c-type cytochrome [Thermodesulfatator autotrophicus]OAG28397.1 hypothetical protein TH606_02125 [Thermodesulfatator autotrophicus]
MRVLLIVASFLLLVSQTMAAEMGKFKYGDFKKPQKCGACHREIYKEWQESLMAKSFTHEWDQVEYFKLALPHALKEPKVAGVKGGCIACHAPLAFLTGDIPPKTAEAGTRANEGVSCEICHNITGSTEKEPFNFSYTIEPGRVKQGPRADAKPKGHKVAQSDFLRSAEFCATCHDEASPYGAWVKETYREWKAGPYAKEGVVCQDCHMYRAPGKAARMGAERADIAHHVFQGSHSTEKLAGAVDIALYANRKKLRPGDTLKIKAVLFNGKVGHMIPSGSSEERMLWLEVWVIDANGKSWHIPVQPKGFKGEEYTIADPNAYAYFAIGEIMEIPNFKGLKRDGNVPAGARIFRRPFFDPKGRMTICQWYTASNDLVDYRIGPRETKIENYVFTIPKDAKGPLTIKANLFYSQVPSSVGEFFKLPEFEYKPLLVNTSEIVVEVE